MYYIFFMLHVLYISSHCCVLWNSNLEMTETQAFLPKAPFDPILVGANRFSLSLMEARQPLPHIHVLRHSVDHLGWLHKAVFLPLLHCTLWQNTSVSGLAAVLDGGLVMERNTAFLQPPKISCFASSRECGTS